MRILTSILTVSIVASSVFAMDDAVLIKKAKDAGLEAIPADTKVLMKKIDPKGEMTQERIELGF